MSGCLITWAREMLGRNLLELFEREGEEVMGFSRKELDVTDTTAVNATVRRCNSAVVVRLARERSPVDVVDDQQGQPGWTVDVAGQIIALVRVRPEGLHAARRRPKPGEADDQQRLPTLGNEAVLQRAGPRCFEISLPDAHRRLEPALRRAFPVLLRSAVNLSY